MSCSTVLPNWEANESASNKIIKWAYSVENIIISHYESTYKFSENSRTTPLYCFYISYLGVLRHFDQHHPMRTPIRRHICIR